MASVKLQSSTVNWGLVGCWFVAAYIASCAPTVTSNLLFNLAGALASTMYACMRDLEARLEATKKSSNPVAHSAGGYVDEGGQWVP
jgi:hypothetical protein